MRERIVAAASKKQLILVTPEKLVDRLGQRGKLPVEVIPFAEPFVRRKLAELSVQEKLEIRPVVRQKDGSVFVTDNGNWILDCALPALEPSRPLTLDAKILSIPGVVDTGFFLGTASAVLVAEKGAVRELLRP